MAESNGRHGGGKAGKEHRYSLPAVDTHKFHEPPPMGTAGNTKEPQAKPEAKPLMRVGVKFGKGPLPDEIRPPKGKGEAH